MSLISFQFIGFCLVLTVVYYLLPGILQNLCLLAAGILFLLPLTHRVESILFLMIAILTAYTAGLLLERCYRTRSSTGEKAVLAAAVLILATILFAFKYLPFVNSLCSLLHIPADIPDFSALAPLGISFYTLQLLSYLADVYQGRIPAEHNILRFLLFGSYFPQMTSGPVSRYEDLGIQFRTRRPFNYQMVAGGYQRMLWGFFKKLVISERAAVQVNTVFGNYGVYSGFYIIFAAVMYSIQLYCDFSGCMDIVIGMSEALGIPLRDNFRSPYLSHSVGEFWHRWHITLSTWLRDYIYIPLGGSRCSKARRYCNIMVTFLVSGFWHGGGWNFIFWGVLHGLYQVIGDLLKPVRLRLASLLHMDRNAFSFRLGQAVITFLLVSLAWIFFRAESLSVGMDMFRSITTWNPALFSAEGFLALGLDLYDILVLVLSLAVLLIVDLLQLSGPVRDRISRQNILFRWILYLSLLFIVLIYGEYGSGFNAESFIYAQF